MLRFDIALQALKRRLASKPVKALPQPASALPAGGILIPFPLRKLTATETASPKRRAPA